MEEDIEIIKSLDTGDDTELKNAIINVLSRLKQLEEDNERLIIEKATALQEVRKYKGIVKDRIPKSKLKEFFSSRLEKYQEADDGKYEQDYLTRGELELVDRYKECKEIAKIILEEEINSEVPQNCIPTSLVEDKIKELKSYEEELTDEQGYWGGSDLLAKIEVLQELLGKE